MLKRYLLIIDTLLLITAVYFMISAYDTLASRNTIQPLQREDTAAQPEAYQPQKSKPLAYYRNIVDRNLFGLVKQAAVKEPDSKTLASLKPTRLNLKLWGTASIGSGQAYAVIEDSSSRRQLLYREGDAIKEAVVKTILNNRVVLNVDGKDEILEMESRTRGGSTSRARSPGREIPTRKTGTDAKQAGRVTQSEADLSRQVRVRPYFEKGKRAGVVLSNIRPDSVFAKVGLANNDILLNVNGKQIMGRSDYQTLLQAIESSSDLRLQVRRKGNEEVIEFSF